MAKTKILTLFGGEPGWQAKDWTSSDDRVRGGKSRSHLDCSDKAVGRFYGTLDIKTLGGAGFASQRTTGEDREYDLSEYKGISISIKKGDKKRYTFNLKDTLLPPDKESGREQSTVSYECDFELPPQTQPGDSQDRDVFIPWSSLNATYRGRLKKDADPIDLKKIKRISIMIRSFFGAQEGDFSLSIQSISALSQVPKPAVAAVAMTDLGGLEDGRADGSSMGSPDSPYYRLQIGSGWAILVEVRIHKILAQVLLLGAIGLLCYRYLSRRP